MIEPKKPTKKITVRRHAQYHFEYVCPRVSLFVFLDWIKENVPKKAKDISIGIGEHKYEEDGDDCWIEISWNEQIKNKQYEAEMRKWRKQQ